MYKIISKNSKQNVRRIVHDKGLHEIGYLAKIDKTEVSFTRSI